MIKKYQRVFLSIIFLSASILFHGCGGGGTTVADGGISGTGITMGRISNFGSIIVDGVRFDVDSASFIRDGIPATGQEEYSVGEFVVIKGKIDNSGLSGIAEEVAFTNEIEGSVTVVTSDGLSLEVLGQKVITNSLTVLIGFTDLSTLIVGNIIEVSGFKDANGDIQATSIKLKTTDFIPGTSEYELKGTVSNLDASTMTFAINDLIIDYSGATLEDFGSVELRDGLFVEVESDSLIVGNVLIADKVELEDETSEFDEGTKAKIEGQITRFNSATDFDVNGLTVTTDTNTEYSDGDINDLTLGAFIELEGKTNSAGVIVAESIEFEENEDELDEYEGFIENVDLGTNKVIVSGKTVVIDSETIMRDESDLNVSPLTLADLALNDKVKVVGVVTPSGEILASKFERKESEAEEQNEDGVDEEDEDESEDEEGQ